MGSSFFCYCPASLYCRWVPKGTSAKGTLAALLSWPVANLGQWERLPGPFDLLLQVESRASPGRLGSTPFYSEDVEVRGDVGLPEVVRPLSQGLSTIPRALAVHTYCE